MPTAKDDDTGVEVPAGRSTSNDACKAALAKQEEEKRQEDLERKVRHEEKNKEAREKKKREKQQRRKRNSSLDRGRGRARDPDRDEGEEQGAKRSNTKKSPMKTDPPAARRSRSRSKGRRSEEVESVISEIDMSIGGASMKANLQLQRRRGGGRLLARLLFCATRRGKRRKPL